MDELPYLPEITKANHYTAALLPPSLKARVEAALGIRILQPVDALCDLSGKRWVIRVGGKTVRITRVRDGFRIQQDRPRHYASTGLPTLQPRRPATADRELLLAVYREVCSGWRQLTDVRFKLLGFTPAVSIVAWIQLLSSDKLNQPGRAWAGIALSVLGLLVTILLWIYDRRNDELYDDLISRGRKIEEELGIDTAIFRGRPRAVDTFVNHSVPVQWIYRLAMGGWVAAALWFASIAGR
jgi:hypothetical protein